MDLENNLDITLISTEGQEFTVKNSFEKLSGIVKEVYNENSYYKNGSICLLNILKNSGKKIIIGGGDTANFVAPVTGCGNAAVRFLRVRRCPF